MRRRSEKECRDLMGLKQRGHCAVDRYGARMNHIVRAQAQCETRPRPAAGQPRGNRARTAGGSALLFSKKRTGRYP